MPCHIIVLPYYKFIADFYHYIHYIPILNQYIAIYCYITLIYCCIRFGLVLLHQAIGQAILAFALYHYFDIH